MKSQKNEILWNIINSGLAGALVLLGSFADGTITSRGVIVALAAAGIIAFTKFKDYWKTQEGKYTYKLFTFIAK